MIQVYILDFGISACSAVWEWSQKLQVSLSLKAFDKEGFPFYSDIRLNLTLLLNCL